MPTAPPAGETREQCTHCNGSGWRWVKIYTPRYGSRGEVSQPCPNCNPDQYAEHRKIALAGQRNFDEMEAKWRQERGS